MRIMYFPGPRKVLHGVKRLREVKERGGPKRVRLNGLQKPEGKLFPTSRAKIEIETRDGGSVRIEPEFPVAPPYAWAYRAGKKLGIPIISAEPERIKLSLPVPRWAWPGA